jgi:hypothetical protein
MRKVGSIITSLSGIMVIVGVFLAWFKFCIYGYCESLSGWDSITASRPFTENGSGYFFMVFIGGIFMAVFALSALIVSLASKGNKAAIAILGIFSMAGALVAIGGCIWFMMSVNDVFSYVSYGFYIAFAAAIIGFIFATLASVFSKGR